MHTKGSRKGVDQSVCVHLALQKRSNDSVMLSENTCIQKPLVIKEMLIFFSMLNELHYVVRSNHRFLLLLAYYKRNQTSIRPVRHRITHNASKIIALPTQNLSLFNSNAITRRAHSLAHNIFTLLPYGRRHRSPLP